MLTLDFGTENLTPRNSNPGTKETRGDVPPGKRNPYRKTLQNRRNRGRSQLLKIAKLVPLENHVRHEGTLPIGNNLLEQLNFKIEGLNQRKNKRRREDSD